MVGESKTSLAYHIKRLDDLGFIENYERKKVVRPSNEGGRIVHRCVECFTPSGVRKIADSFATERADQASKLCDRLIDENKCADFGRIENHVYG
jgi:hypothetical protein